jgi:hypothetical protein
VDRLTVGRHRGCIFHLQKHESVTKSWFKRTFLRSRKNY